MDGPNLVVVHKVRSGWRSQRAEGQLWEDDELGRGKVT